MTTTNANITTSLVGLEDLSQAAAGGTASRTRNVNGTTTTGTISKVNASNYPVLATADAAAVAAAGGSATYPGPAITEAVNRMRAPVANAAGLAAVALASCTDRQLCYVDSLEAWYAFDAASTTTANNNGVIAPTGAATGRWIETGMISGYVDARRYGVKHDATGTIDQTSSMEAAIAAADTAKAPLLVPGGSIGITTGGLKIPNGLVIQGAGMGVTIFVQLADVTVFTQDATAGSTSRAHLRDFQIQGRNNTTDTNPAMAFTSWFLCSMERIWIYQCNRALRFYTQAASSGASTSAFNMVDCYINRCETYGLKVDGAYSLHITGCRFEKNKDGTGNIVLDINNTAANAVSARAFNNVSFTGCHFEQVSLNFSGTGLLVEGCHIGSSDIRMTEYSNEARIRGNFPVFSRIYNAGFNNEWEGVWVNTREDGTRGPVVWRPSLHFDVVFRGPVGAEYVVWSHLRPTSADVAAGSATLQDSASAVLATFPYDAMAKDADDADTNTRIPKRTFSWVHCAAVPAGTTGLKTSGASTAYLRRNMLVNGTFPGAVIGGWSTTGGGAVAAATCTGDTTNTSTSVTNVSNTTMWRLGSAISGTNIPAGATVTAIAGTTLTISAAATGTASGTTLTAGNQVRLSGSSGAGIYQLAPMMVRGRRYMLLCKVLARTGASLYVGMGNAWASANQQLPMKFMTLTDGSALGMAVYVCDGTSTTTNRFSFGADGSSWSIDVEWAAVVDLDDDRMYSNERPSSSATTAWTGSYALGQMLWNTTPAAGAPLGWICVTAGTISATSFLPWPSISGSTTTDVASIAAGATATVAITVTGAVAGDVAAWSVDAALPTGIVVSSVVCTANTVTLTLFNPTGSAVDPPSRTYYAKVLKP